MTDCRSGLGPWFLDEALATGFQNGHQTLSLRLLTLHRDRDAGLRAGAS
jgi:hypothetical protein